LCARHHIQPDVELVDIAGIKTFEKIKRKRCGLGM